MGLYKKKGRILRSCALILCLAALIAMSGCDPLSRWAPPEVSEKWVSSDPEMVLNFEQDGQQNCWILWNGTRTEADVGFRAGSGGGPSADGDPAAGKLEIQGRQAALFH